MVFGYGQFAFATILMFTVIDPASVVPLWTSIPSAVIIGSFAAAFWKTGAKKGAVASAITAAIWIAVALLRHPPA